MRKNALLSVALLAGIFGSTMFAQPAHAQLADILKNALGGQLGNQLGGQFGSQNTIDPYNSQTQTGAGGLLGSILPFVGGGANAGVGSSLLDSLRPQGGNQFGYQPDQSQDQQDPYANNYYGNSYSGAYDNGFGNLGNFQPVVFNGVSLDSAFYSGPYRGSPHQIESAMNLDLQMTVLKEQIQLGVSDGFLTSSDAGMFSRELNSIAGQKQRVVRRNGLSFNDSENLVIRLNNLVDQVRQAWYRNSFADNGYGGNGRAWRGGRRDRSVSGRVMPSGKNEALENLYLMTRPSGGYGR